MTVGVVADQSGTEPEDFGNTVWISIFVEQTSFGCEEQPTTIYVQLTAFQNHRRLEEW